MFCTWTMEVVVVVVLVGPCPPPPPVVVGRGGAPSSAWVVVWVVVWVVLEVGPPSMGARVWGVPPGPSPVA